MDYHLIVKEITSCQATLKDQDNNLIYLPIEKLPRNLNIGQTINLQINFETANPKNIIAKEILNELLGGKKTDA
jgi:ABC-type lipoprotein release transport system permease subunit